METSSLRRTTKFKWLNPNILDLPHRVTRPEQVDSLVLSLTKCGWCGPPLIAYWHGNAIQLLSGTHRAAAARQLDMVVPVIVHPYDVVEKAWGTPEWQDLMDGSLTWIAKTLHDFTTTQKST